MPLRKFQTFDELVELIDSGKPIRPRIHQAGVPGYEVGHILSNELKISDVRVLPRDKVLARGDIITGRVGGLGSFALYDSDDAASFSDNVLRIRLLSAERSRALFIVEYLNSDIGNAQVIRDSRGSLQRVITQRSLGETPIPSLGKFEDILVAEMNASRTSRKAKLADANALLTNLDSYFLDTLSITLPAEDSRRVFAVSLTDQSKPRRLDSDYYHPERSQTLRALASAEGRLRVVRLAEVVNLEQLQIRTPAPNYLSLAHVESHTGELTDSEDTATGACLVYQEGDVLFARLRPYLNKVYRAEMDGCCSPEFRVLRVKHDAGVLPDYLAVALRSRLTLSQTKHMMTGNTHPRLRDDDIQDLTIPIPSLQTQHRIASEIEARRFAARQLRQEAEAEWQEAKRWFERQLLEPRSAEGGPNG